MQNAFGESFNSRLRDGCLNEYDFSSLFDVRLKLARWREHYKCDRPHGNLNWQTPEEYARQIEDPRMKYIVVFAIVAAITIGTAADAGQMSLAEQAANQSLLKSAWNELYSTPQNSLRIFKSQLTKWASFSKQSTGYIDADRGSLIAAVLAGDESAAHIS